MIVGAEEEEAVASTIPSEVVHPGSEAEGSAREAAPCTEVPTMVTPTRGHRRLVRRPTALLGPQAQGFEARRRLILAGVRWDHHRPT